MSTAAAIDVAALRADFPILSRRVHGAPLVYLDSAATSQKPTAVLDAMEAYYRETNANVHRGVYELAAEATARFEAGRDAVARLVGAPREGVVFAKNASEAINLVAWAWGARELKPGDEVLVTEMEHHSNIVPVADRGRDHRRDGPLRARHAGRRARHGRPARAAVASARGWSASSTPATSSARSTRSPRSPHLAHERRRPLPGGRLAERPPHAGGRPGHRLRLLRLHRPQDARPHRHRLPGRHARDPRRHGPLPGRRRDDLQRHHRGQHLGRPALEVRGRHPADRRGRGAGRRRRVPDGRRHGGRARPRDGDGRAHARRARRRSPTSRSTGRATRAPAARRSRSACPTCTPTTSPSSSTATGSASAPATTAPSR